MRPAHMPLIIDKTFEGKKVIGLPFGDIARGEKRGKICEVEIINVKRKFADCKANGFRVSLGLDNGYVESEFRQGIFTGYHFFADEAHYQLFAKQRELLSKFKNAISGRGGETLSIEMMEQAMAVIDALNKE